MALEEQLSYKVEITDLEFDPVTLTFHDGYYVEIDTSRYKYLHFDLATLHEIIELLEEAKQKFNNRNNDGI